MYRLIILLKRLHVKYTQPFYWSENDVVISTTINETTHITCENFCYDFRPRFHSVLTNIEFQHESFYLTTRKAFIYTTSRLLHSDDSIRPGQYHNCSFYKHLHSFSTLKYRQNEVLRLALLYKYVFIQLAYQYPI